MATHSKSIDVETVIGDQDLFSIARALSFPHDIGVKPTPEILSETLSLMAQKAAG